MRRFPCIILVLAHLLPSGWALAGSLHVTPIRINLTTREPTAVLTVRNGSSEARIIQIEGMLWSQQNGKDSYAPSRDLLATPPIFTIAPGGTQIIRVGLRRQLDSRQELAYRIFLQEVPIEANSEGQVRVVLRLGVPVFVAPVDAAAKPWLAWQIVVLSQKKARVQAMNYGEAHVQIGSFSIRDAGGATILPDHHEMRYLLPEQGHHWIVELDRAYPPGTKMNISARTDSGEVNALLVLEQ